MSNYWKIGSFDSFIFVIRRFLKKNNLPQTAASLIDNAGAHPSLSKLKYRGTVVIFLYQQTEKPDPTNHILQATQWKEPTWRNFNEMWWERYFIKHEKNNDERCNILECRFLASSAILPLRKVRCEILNIQFIEIDNLGGELNLQRIFQKIPESNEMTAKGRRMGNSRLGFIRFKWLGNCRISYQND